MSRVINLDNRGLEPPEPMLRTLEAAAALGEGDVLVVLNDRRPMFLYPRLEQKGFRHETEDLPDGGAKITIRRNG